MNPIRVAVLQRVCTEYRAGLFRKLTESPDLKIRLFIGDDAKNSKIRSTSDLSGLELRRLPTKFFRLRNRLLVHHRGLVESLKEFEPDVILTEGESHILGYLQAIRYRRKYPNVKLIHWGGGGLPGDKIRMGSLKNRILRRLHRSFDSFMVYSSFCKNWLVELGHDSDRIFVATNVGLTHKHLEAASNLSETPSEARTALQLPNKFTVLYVGTLDANKRPDVLLDLAATTDPSQFNYVLLGGGSQHESLRQRSSSENLENVFLPGNVGSDLSLYYRAADVVVIPGRGGIVISEAMAWNLPVIVHEADGTEFDLVKDGTTGRHLSDGSVESFRNAIEQLRTTPDQLLKLGDNAHQSLVEEFGIEQMIKKMTTGIITTYDRVNLKHESK
jgi:glycosyltransferase involved in cell wall biosynthesis